MKKQIIFLSTGLILFNLLTYFLLLPYAQQTANSHVNSGPAFGIIYCIVSSILLSASIYQLFKHSARTTFVLFFIFAVNFIYWAYILCTLQCLDCTNGG